VTGLTDGTAYTFNVVAANSSGSGVTSTVSNSVTNGDVYFSSVGLLLKTSPTDGINNNDFIDYSGNFFPVRVGTPIGTYFNPYGLTAGGASASGYFNGSTDYLRIDDNQLLQPESGDFTYEAWIYPLTAASGSNYKFIWGHRSGAGTFGGAMIGFNSSLTLLYFIANAAATTWQRNAVSTGLSVTLNTWQHIALTRSGNTVTCYLNGGAGTPVTVATGAIGTTGNFVLMAGIQTGGQNIDGYMTDFRLVKGTAIVPPSGGPTTPLTAVVNTVILIKINPGIYDASPRSLTAGSRVFTLGTSRSSIDTAVWGPTSMVFSSAGASQLSMPKTTDLQFGTGDFTVECWSYLTSKATSYPAIFSNYLSYTTGALALYAGHNSGVTTQYQVGINGAAFGSTTGIQSGASNPIIYNAWTHLAVVRSSGVISLYVNGVRVGNQVSSSAALNGVNTNFYVGGQDATSYINGYIQDFRVTNGIARYTSTPFSTPKNAFSTAIAPVGIPNAPTVGSATAATPTSAVVSYIMPDSDGGSTITGYTAVSSPGSITGSVSQATSGFVIITGLTPNTTYTFTVYATNAYGNSQSSSVSNSITTAAASAPFFSYMVVAGGGGSGAATGGGGGAGGLLTGNVTYTAGVTYTVSVGPGGQANILSPAQTASNGTNSSISGTGLTTITAIGGGRGSSGLLTAPAGTGGSGGGGCYSTSGSATVNSLGAAGTAGQGNDGGNATISTPNIGPGGGGGAGAVGSSNTTPHRGGEPGGIGVVSYLITAAIASSRAVGQVNNGFVYFAGGGGGGGYCGSTINPIPGGLGGGGSGGESLAGVDGTPNTGGGAGGGAQQCGSINKNGAAGGSGVVIITSPYTAVSVTGSVYTDTVGNNAVYTFIGPGTITF
jgi:hypothetical protein